MTGELTLVDGPVVLPGFVSRPRQTAPGRRDIVFWDVDGTLVRGDSLLPFLLRFTTAARLTRDLADCALRHRDRNAAKAALLQRVLGGRELGAVDAVARDYVLGRLLKRLRPDTLARWRWHRHQGHRVVLASASPEVYLTHLARTLGADDVLATRLVVVNGRLTGGLAGGNCRGPEKARRIAEYLAGRNAGPMWFYGDSRADRHAAALADIAVRVSPFHVLSPQPEDRDGCH